MQFPAAFPEPVAAQVVLPASKLAPRGEFTVRTALGQVTIPERIYNRPPLLVRRADRLAVSCLYTRHHNGRVRERHLRSIIGAAEPWVVPFVVRLVGDYVVEIVDVIRDAALDRTTYGDFIARNPAFLGQTESRVVSYWDCYYRSHWRNLADYPGYAVVRWLRSAAEETGVVLPRPRLPGKQSGA